ncbi:MULTISPECIES: D-alanyl-D-alanine carboxypeptidase/D-alanyl-D-alanine-endopeptidase [unclassified Crossiella]|uniref:D-alanyl-D-alanine carboxypeptidase/D-alanyl-D-alanine endopeptidase n=1 Tax=unclassified Crossiella TaxID=2620835 RepID=UPI001FFF5A9F|nr:MULTISPECIES: D-alanyl-D-alanine carboxypeptidase/D-alanyl-D-alanine-endopeptidase [unclassified Crossiella]MCK2243330.1 D-alanyl-D-alanine carboxypeptidase/D-alanyl-D-alanine-endopeptidase [Crossiella sp. S99.2]MCK2254201.1 D-alanyl-D-alanine carboxypeptidase/D-alanyl-D-alanine-endopeptidase [Crossiella sp. S99.1]
MPRPRLLAILCATALLGGLVTGSAAAGDDPSIQSLTTDLDQILADPRLAGAGAGVVVRSVPMLDPASRSSVEDGQVLYRRGGADRLQPASNAKLLTSAAALEVLGPDHRFTTSVLADSSLRGSVLHGDLYLRGSGDPTTLAADYEALAQRVADTGIKVVTGKVVADDSAFDPVRLGVSWAWDDEPFYYSAQVGALTVAPDTDYDAGTVIVRVRPAAAGQKPAIELSPPTSIVTIDNRATTGAPGSASSIVVERQHGTNTVVITGSAPANGNPSAHFSTVDDPARYAADVFRAALTRRGVQVLDPKLGTGVTPAHFTELAAHRSMPLSQLLVPFMKLSNNGHAEILVKAMGKAVHGKGTWADGIRAMTPKLAALGLSANAYRLVDGSGLSRMDMVSADQLTALLAAARSRPWYPVWHHSLPVAGHPDRMVGGTLRTRLRGTPAEGRIRAKTGSLTAVSALSGYVTGADGKDLAFAVVTNNVLSGTKDLEDRIALRLAMHPAGPAARSIPLEPPAGDPWLECSWRKAC